MDEMNRLRNRIDSLDAEIVATLAQRFEVVRMIGQLKRSDGIAMMQPERVRHVREHYQSCGREQGIPTDFTTRFVELLLAATCAMEDEIIAG